jgi:hypothetical protein
MGMQSKACDLQFNIKKGTGVAQTLWLQTVLDSKPISAFY